jgi:hypothetical protein
MEFPMALWKIEHGPVPTFPLHAPAPHLDRAGLVAIAVAPVLVLVALVPLPLVLPVLSIVSFAIAAGVALLAHRAKVGRRAPGINLWDLAAVFTLIWIGAGIFGGSKRFAQLFETLTALP